MYAIRSYYVGFFGALPRRAFIIQVTGCALLAKLKIFSSFNQRLARRCFRITSYNVCYTKLLRLYAQTRLPLYSQATSFPLVAAVVGPMFILPNVGLNEWGHAFWFVDELFAAPLHWGFVTLGWCGLFGAGGGVAAQIVSRMSNLADVIWNNAPKSILDPFPKQVARAQAAMEESAGGGYYRITSYNVCYTKLLRVDGHHVAEDEPVLGGLLRLPLEEG